MEYLIIGFAITVIIFVVIFSGIIISSANDTIKDLDKIDKEERERMKNSMDAFVRSNNLSVIEEIAMQPYSDISWEKYMEISRMSNEDFDLWFENYWKTDGN